MFHISADSISSVVTSLLFMVKCFSFSSRVLLYCRRAESSTTRGIQAPTRKQQHLDLSYIRIYHFAFLKFLLFHISISQLHITIAPLLYSSCHILSSLLHIMIFTITVFVFSPYCVGLFAPSRFHNYCI